MVALGKAGLIVIDCKLGFIRIGQKIFHLYMGNRNIFF